MNGFRDSVHSAFCIAEIIRPYIRHMCVEAANSLSAARDQLTAYISNTKMDPPATTCDCSHMTFGGTGHPPTPFYLTASLSFCSLSSPCSFPRSLETVAALGPFDLSFMAGYCKSCQVRFTAVVLHQQFCGLHLPEHLYIRLQKSEV